MKNKKLEKTFVKIGFSAFITALLGLTYKAGRQMEDAVDAKYERDHGIDPNDSKPW